MTSMQGRLRRTAGRLARRAGWRPAPAPPRRTNGRVAFVGPMPPSPTGIATYHRAVIEGLERIGFTDRHPVDPLVPGKKTGLRAIQPYDLGVYQLGNHVDHHRHVYRLAWSTPGLVVLHDLALDDFVRGLQSIGDPLGFRAVAEAASLRHRIGTSPETLANDPLAVPWAAAAARAARGVIVLSDFGRRYLEGIGCLTPIFVVPHPAVESDEALTLAAARARDLRAGLAERRLVVAPGDVNATKQHEAILKALIRLPEDVHLTIVGRRAPDYEIGRLVERHGVRDRVTVALDVSDHEFLAWIVAADVVIDLRHPHRGEVSGSLARAMQAGKPTIVSAIGTYLDVPDEAVVRVPAGRTKPEALRVAVHGLLDESERRDRIGRAAGEHVRHQRSTEATAHGYADAILATRELIRDPVRMIVARWARSLAESGVDESLVDEGFGASYVRALDSFSSRSGS